MTITKYWYKNQCMIKYKTDIQEYIEYWYNNTKDLLKDYEFIVIESLMVPMEIPDSQVVELLKEFARLMTIENKIVIYDNEEFIKYLERKGDTLYYDNCVDVLDRILSEAGYDCIQAFDYSYNYKDVYIYTHSKLGIIVYNIIMEYFGYNDYY